MIRIYFAICLLVCAQYAIACQCLGNPSIQKDWENNNHVFIGEVIDQDTALYNNNGIPVVCFKIKIIETFKQNYHPSYLYRSFCIPIKGGSCAYWFSKMDKYLIYATDKNDVLQASSCGRTELYSEVDTLEIAELKKLKASYKEEEGFVIQYPDNESQEEVIKDDDFREGWKYAFFTLAMVLIIILLRKFI